VGKAAIHLLVTLKKPMFAILWWLLLAVYTILHRL